MADLRPQVWTAHSKCHGNNISYYQALRCLAEVAITHKALPQCDEGAGRCTTISDAPKSNSHGNESQWEEVSVLAAYGRTCAQGYTAAYSTPASDTSAMDGFAVVSALTVKASAEAPVRFRVAGTIAAGTGLYDIEDARTDIHSSTSNESPCVEIMTGARFPGEHFPQLDAVVKVEDVELIEQLTPDGKSIVKFILVSAPVRTRQHRRPAGSDFEVGDLIIARGVKTDHSHIMALVSVGVRQIEVLTERNASSSMCNEQADSFSVAVLPTGSELVNIFGQTDQVSVDDECRQRFPDSNGPYMTSVLRSVSPSLHVDYMGPCQDDEDSLTKAFGKAIHTQRHDVLVTSGGVSMGRFDLVRKVLESQFDADIIFHGCLIRPGAPVLFGVVNRANNGPKSTQSGMTIVLGAPGNPIAAAMTVRFFLKPLVKMLQAAKSLSADELVQLTLVDSLPVQLDILGEDKMRKKPTKAVAFLLARRQRCDISDTSASSAVELLEDQASYKIKPFVQADCWVAVPAGQDRVCSGEHVRSYSLW